MKRVIKQQKCLRTVFYFFLACFLCTPLALAVDYTFQWDPNHPNDNVVTYRFYWSTVSGGFNQIDVDNIPNASSPVFDPANPQYTKSLPDPAPGQLVPVYYFAVTAKDADGFESDYSLEIDTAAPQITSTPTVVATTDSSATVVWTTDKPGTSVVEYGPTTAYGSTAPVPSSTQYQTSHSVTITSLAASTTYHFRVSSVNAQGIGPTHMPSDSNPSVDYTLITKATGQSDTTAPAIVSIPTVVAVSYDTATIDWATDELSDSVVEYGLTTAYGKSKTIATDVTAHSVTITGLDNGTDFPGCAAGGCLFHFRVGSEDAAGNGPTYSADDTLTTSDAPDTAPPVIVAAPTVTSITDTTAVVEWTTDEPSDSLVEFGKTPYARSKYLGGYVTNHVVTLTLLDSETQYYFRAGSTDASGNGPVYSSGSTFTTEKTPDITAPVISATPTVTGVTDTTATIVWDTDESSNSQVRYAQSDKAWGSLDYTVNKAEMTTHHVVTLTDLDVADGAADTWYFRVGSTDAEGNGPDSNPNGTNPNPADTAQALSFATLIDADETPPAIVSAPTVTAVSDTTATIEWQTDEPANSQVRYDTVAADWATYTRSKNNATMVTHHSVTLTGLDYETKYYFRVGSTDIGGNTPDSTTPDDNNPTNSELSFTTLADLAPPQITAPPTVTGITNDSAVIEWSTDEPGNSQVRFGTASADWTGYPSSKNDGVMVSNHSVTISGLSGDKTYFFRVGSTDIEGNGPTVSTEVTFKTDPDPDTTPPQFASPPIVTLKTNDSATINWTTDEPSNSLVQYGTSMAVWGSYDSSTNDAAIVTVHSVTITGLAGGTTYYFRAGSYDTAGNGPAVSSEVSFTTNSDPDTTPPQIVSPPSVTIKTNSSATIEWATNEESNSQIQFQAEDEGLPWTPLSWGAYANSTNNADMVTSHSLTLTNLIGSTTYHFRVGSIDSSGNGPTTSAEGVFTTQPDPDITAPQFTAPPTVTFKSNESATISWSTDEPGNSQVQYGESSADWGTYTSSENDAGMVTVHSVSLSGLFPSTQYYLRVGSIDAAGNGPVISNEVTFSTEAAPDTTPPQFTAPPTVTIKSNDSATIVWTTDEPGNSQIQYGETSALWDNYASIENDADMVTYHSVTISGLTGNTMYYLRAGSIDAAGNGPLPSNEIVFITDVDPDTTLPAIISPPTVTVKTDASATIEWDTDEPSNSVVQYGLESGTWSTYALSEEDSVFVTHHSVTITDLDNIPVVVEGVQYEYDEQGNIIGEIPFTTIEYECTEGNCKFYFRVGSTDAAGNGPVTSTEVTFTTDPVPDTTPPEITAPPTVTIKTNTSATITWSTDEPGNSQVEYGTDSADWGSYDASENDADLVTTHNVTLTGLSGSTTYYFRVGSTDAAGNGPLPSNEVSFTTAPDPDTKAPRITIPPTVTDKTVGSATIEWQTDEPSTSEVRFGRSGSTWGNYPYIESDSGMATTHIVTITGLDDIIGCESGGCLFYFMVGSTDAAGNDPDPFDVDSNNPFSQDTFVTQIAPDEKAPKVISGPVVTAVDGYSAIIEWQTDEPGNSIVRYDVATNVWDTYAFSEGDAALVTNHSVTLTSLLPSTAGAPQNYFFRVGSTDAQGNGPELNQDSDNPTAEFTFQTADVADTFAPVVSAVTISWVTNQTALIEWKTDEPANSKVAYGTNAGAGSWDDYPFTENDPDMLITHSATITDLQPSTHYYFRVASTDAKGNVSSPSAELEFTTDSGPDLSAPQISNVQIQVLSGSTAVVTWNTDEPGNSQVRYGPYSSEWDAYPYSENDAEMVRQHQVTLSNLVPSTLYYLRVGSTDASGNNYTTSLFDANPSIEYNLTTTKAEGPSILIYPNPEYPKVDFSKNTIDITYNETNMQRADVKTNYVFSPGLTYTETDPVELVSSTSNTSTYRLSFVSVPQYTIFSLTVTEEITDADGYQVEPKTVLINDNDADELADDWELAVGLDPTSADDSIGQGKDGDLDGDGYSNYEEFINATDPLNENSYPTPPEYLATIPHDGAGIDDNFRVANNSSFAVHISDSGGIDVTNTGNIKFTIDDSTNDPYEVDLSHANVRIVKLVDTDIDDTSLTKFWVIYDRANDNTYDGVYPYWATVQISVASINNNQQYGMVTYKFRVESMVQHEYANSPTRLPDFSSIGVEDPDVSGGYDTGLKVDSGDLVGAKIIYNSSEPIQPTFGITDELPTFEIANRTKLGVSINLQPPTVFSTPVKLIIPAPGSKNTSNVNIYMFDGENWVLGCNKNGTEYKEGWYVPGSRIDAKYRVEIKVYHFTGVQAAVEATGTDTDVGAGDSRAEASCFINTILE